MPTQWVQVFNSAVGCLGSGNRLTNMFSELYDVYCTISLGLNVIHAGKTLLDLLPCCSRSVCTRSPAKKWALEMRCVAPLTGAAAWKMWEPISRHSAYVAEEFVGQDGEGRSTA
jgi:hypothetical protein